MDLRERWNELDTGAKVVVGLGVGIAVLVIAILVLVIIAAVVASFVLGIGEPVPTTPQLSVAFDYEESGENVTAIVTHDGGDSVEAGRLFVEVDGTRTVPWTDDEDGEITAGDSVRVPAEPGGELRVVYRGPESSSTLAVDTVPTAGTV